MTWYDVYIGRTDDPDFDWDGWEDGKQDGSPAPQQLSPVFPLSSIGKGEFWALINGIEAGRFAGKQTSCCSWVAVASKDAIVAFIEELYPGGPKIPAQLQTLQALRDFVDGMDDDGQFALVAFEI